MLDNLCYSIGTNVLIRLEVDFVEIIDNEAGSGLVIHQLAAYISRQITECEKCNGREFKHLAVTGHDFALKRVYNVLEQFPMPHNWFEDVAELIQCRCCGRFLRLDHRIFVNEAD